MGQYCDSKQLEQAWFLWLLSSRVPDLEFYREQGLLWTKVIGTVTVNDVQLTKHGKPLPDPSYAVRQHCIALASPVFFKSHNGIVPETASITINQKQETIDLTEVRDEINLLSNAELHRLENPLQQIATVVPSLYKDEYLKEQPTYNTWHRMLTDIGNMCNGIAMKFKLATEEEQNDLANEALLQVMTKLKNYRLVYTPGRAPVFNLLTTTIHRCMFSIMNRRRNKRNGFNKLAADMLAGILPDNRRSLKIKGCSNLKYRSHY